MINQEINVMLTLFCSTYLDRIFKGIFFAKVLCSCFIKYLDNILPERERFLKTKNSRNLFYSYGLQRNKFLSHFLINISLSRLQQKRRKLQTRLQTTGTSLQFERLFERRGNLKILLLHSMSPLMNSKAELNQFLGLDMSIACDFKT